MGEKASATDQLILWPLPQIQDIVRSRQLLTVFREGKDGQQDVDVAILQALLKGEWWHVSALVGWLLPGHLTAENLTVCHSVGLSVCDGSPGCREPSWHLGCAEGPPST